MKVNIIIRDLYGLGLKKRTIAVMEMNLIWTIANNLASGKMMGIVTTKKMQL